MKLMLLAALTLSLLLAACSESPGGASDQSSIQPVPAISARTVHLSATACQALQDQAATLQHLFTLSRGYPGDSEFDPQLATARLKTMASLLQQLSETRVKLTACPGNTR